MCGAAPATAQYQEIPNERRGTAQPAGGEAVAPPATPALTGPETWEGEVDAGGFKLGFVVRVQPKATGPGVDATLDIPQQGLSRAPLSEATVEGNLIVLLLSLPGSPPARFKMERDQNDPGLAAGTLEQGGASFPVSMHRLKEGEQPKGIDRPQTPIPPFPYESRELTFPGGGQDVMLSGTLTVPEGKGPHPAVVLITGSGPQDRDETLLGHKPFAVLADHLTRRGIAVLRYDDRGVGRSTGEFGVALTDDFAADAKAAAEFLGKQEAIDPARIGLIGHSEGALAAPIVAAESRGISFVVLLAGPGVDGRETLKAQLRAILKSAGVEDKMVELQSQTQGQLLDAVVADAKPEDAKALLRRLMALQSGDVDPAPERLAAIKDEAVEQGYAQMASPWMRRFLSLDPKQYLRKVTVPVLALNGTLDTQVIPDLNLPAIEKTLSDAGNPDVTCLGINGLNHLFQNCKTGSPTEYSSISETFAPAALEKISSWIRQRTGLDPRQEAKPAEEKK